MGAADHHAVEAGAQARLTEVLDALHAVEQPGSGLLRSLTLTETADPSRVHMLVVFESEDKARKRESNPQRQEALVPVREKMSHVFEGAPAFTDLNVGVERTY